MYDPQDLRARLTQQPFVPLRIVASSGKKYDVFHPEMAVVGVRDIHVFFSSAMDPLIYDGISRIALAHITALEDLPKKNGKKKKHGKD